MVVRIEKARLPPSRLPRPPLLRDAPSRGHGSSGWKRRTLQAFVFVAILSPLCLAPGADALFLKKKLKLLKASKGKFGLRPQPRPQHTVGAAWLPPPQWVPPPPAVPPHQSVPFSGPPVAHWSYPGDYSGWVHPAPQPAPAHGWVAAPPTVHAAHPPPQGPTTTYVVEAPVSPGTAFASAAGKGAHRPRGPQQEYQYTLHCPYELYVQAEQPANNKDRW